MDCGDIREHLSARLDGEDDPGLRATVDVHLQGCAACRRWLDGAARVTRLARTTSAHPTPDLTGTVLERHHALPRRWPRYALRAALAGLGLGQLVLGLAHIVTAGRDVIPAHEAAQHAMTITHAVHEFAAWNIAIGVGFLWIAWHGARTAGIVPTLAAFVLLLTGLEALDLARGHADLEGLFSHALVQAGLIVVLILRSKRFGGYGNLPGPAPRPAGPRPTGRSSVATV